MSSLSETVAVQSLNFSPPLTRNFHKQLLCCYNREALFFCTVREERCIIFFLEGLLSTNFVPHREFCHRGFVTGPPAFSFCGPGRRLTPCEVRGGLPPPQLIDDDAVWARGGASPRNRSFRFFSISQYCIFLGLLCLKLFSSYYGLFFCVCALSLLSIFFGPPRPLDPNPRWHPSITDPRILDRLSRKQESLRRLCLRPSPSSAATKADDYHYIWCPVLILILIPILIIVLILILIPGCNLHPHRNPHPQRRERWV